MAVVPSGTESAKVPKKIFVSYSHADERLRKKLETALATLRIDHTAELTIWNDRLISTGSAWQPQIERALADASVAILLITPNFLASDFIQKREIPELLDRRQMTGLSLFPILAKACAWEAVSWLRQIQLIPRDNKPVWRSAGRYVDEELANIVLEVLTAVQRPVKLPEVRLLVDEARALYEEIAKNAAVQKTERDKVARSLHEKVFSLTQDLKLRPKKRVDKAFNNMDAYIRE